MRRLRPREVKLRSQSQDMAEPGFEPRPCWLQTQHSVSCAAIYLCVTPNRDCAPCPPMLAHLAGTQDNDAGVFIVLLLLLLLGVDTLKLPLGNIEERGAQLGASVGTDPLLGPRIYSTGAACLLQEAPRPRNVSCHLRLMPSYICPRSEDVHLPSIPRQLIHVMSTHAPRTVAQSLASQS